MLFSNPTLAQWLWAFALNALLIALAQRLPLLTSAGWIHAGALGTILWGCLGWRGWLAVVIYLVLGSMVTRLGMAQKKLAGLAEGRGGRRGPENVWGSAATGAVVAILIKLGLGSQSLLMIGFAASFAAKLADTFGSGPNHCAHHHAAFCTCWYGWRHQSRGHSRKRPRQSFDDLRDGLPLTVAFWFPGDLGCFDWLIGHSYGEPFRRNCSEQN